MYATYTGELFFHDEDVFVDKAEKTVIFLLKNDSGDIFLYFLDMDAYVSIKGPDAKIQSVMVARSCSIRD